MSDGYIYESGKSQKEIYEQLHAEGDYACGSHGNGTEIFLDGCESLLDVGGGRSRYAHDTKARLALRRVVVADISENACLWHIARGMIAIPCDALQGLPFDDCDFDAVTCFDCLEHLPPDGLPFVLRELARVAAKVVVITVPNDQAKDKGENGELLHLTVQPMDWWAELIEAVLGLKPEVRRYIQRYRAGNIRNPRYCNCFVVKV
jgi:SAM-dependent methyltransferase